MKKALSLFLALLMLFALSGPTYATSISTPPEYPTQEKSSTPSAVEKELITVSVPNILSQSTNISRSNGTLRGTFSAEYDSSETGFSYYISFDWIATPDDNGTYFFSSIPSSSPPVILRDEGVLSVLWESADCTVTHHLYSISSSREYVQLYLSLHFEIREKHSFALQSFNRQYYHEFSVEAAT